MLVVVWCTLQAAQLAKRLSTEEGAQDQPYDEHVLAELRANGVRLQNCELNTGKPRYAFNALQKQLLPPELRPPANLTSGDVQS